MTAGTTQQANVEQAVPLFAVSNMTESLRFYVDGLGFVVTNQWVPEGKLKWCWLQLGGAAVMLQEINRDGPHAWKPGGKLGVGVSINFICRDALALYREFRAKGVGAGRPFVGNGMWVTSLTDPDGYLLHFESYTDAPEESEYEEPA
jgi:lactoylglutathione lyase